ncbi:MAG: hypothetical protein E6Q42_10565 [Dechloromonas sp.]|nr:MAG: hypothetical protein E6Q42_10565 [Dechloromonas sp.]
MCNKAANYAKLKLHTWNGEARLFSQALDEAVHVFPLIEAVRLIAPTVSPEEIRSWRIGLFVPVTENLKRSCKNGSNITVWMVAAISAVAAEFELADAMDFSMRSDYGLPKLLAMGISDDHFWYEMSLQYQDYVVRALAEWMYSIGIRRRHSNSVSETEFNSIGKQAADLMLAPLVVRFANMEQPMLNDGTKLSRVPNQELWGFVWRVLPTRIGLAQSAQSKNWDMLLDLPPDLPETRLPGVTSKRLDGLYAVQLVGKNWQSLMRYGQRSSGHAHQESLHYDLQYRGVWIFRDIGTVGYGSPLHSEFFRRAQAHSVPLVARDGQKPWPSVGHLAYFDTNTLTAKAVHENYQPGSYVSRTLQIDESHFFDRVDYDLGKKSAPVGLVFNTPCAVTPISGVQANFMDTAGDDVAFRYWTARKFFDTKSEISLTLDCKGGEFDVRLSGKAIKMLLIGQTPDTQRPAKRQGIFLETDSINKTSIEIEIKPK